MLILLYAREHVQGLPTEMCESLDAQSNCAQINIQCVLFMFGNKRVGEGKSVAGGGAVNTQANLAPPALYISGHFVVLDNRYYIPFWSLPVGGSP